MERIHLFCFGASYAVAFGLDLLHQARPRPVLRLGSLGFTAAGLFAQTVYLLMWQPPLASQFGWLLFVGWILAIFSLHGGIHYQRQAWGVFVLPVVLVLVLLAGAFGPPLDTEGNRLSGLFSRQDLRVWAWTHAGLLVLATVGMCVGCVASVMYLFKARQLRTKVLPGHGLRLFSLERLEEMNRRAVNASFPLLTAGLILGAMLMAQAELSGWTDPRVIAAVVLWIAFALVVYLRYAAHVRGRPLALATIAAFVLLLVTLVVPHTLPHGGTR